MTTHCFKSLLNRLIDVRYSNANCWQEKAKWKHAIFGSIDWKIENKHLTQWKTVKQTSVLLKFSSTNCLVICVWSGDRKWGEQKEKAGKKERKKKQKPRSYVNDTSNLDDVICITFKATAPTEMHLLHWPILSDDILHGAHQAHWRFYLFRWTFEWLQTHKCYHICGAHAVLSWFVCIETRGL